MSEEESIKFWVTEESVEEDPVFSPEKPFEAEKISISSTVVPLERLITRLVKGTIAAPEIQREDNLWNDEKQSRLIESLMLRIPLPMFYVAEDIDGNWNIVDGLQRLCAIRRYVIAGNPDYIERLKDKDLGKSSDQLKLQNLEFLKNLEGVPFAELPEKYRNRILDTQFQFAVISVSTPPEVQRNIFKRLNTGGLPLTAQEVRHAIYYKKETAIFLKQLVAEKSFLQSTDGKVSDSRMAASELVLRFIAFMLRGVEAYPKNNDMDAFLSDTMLLLNAMPDMEQAELRRSFWNRKDVPTECRIHTFEKIHDLFVCAMERAYELFGKNAFRKSMDEKKRSPINKALFEMEAVELAMISEERFQYLLNHRNVLMGNLKQLLQTDLDGAVSRDSWKSAVVPRRFEIMHNLFEKKMFI